MSCEKTSQVHAYHDGELPDDQRQAMQAHLEVCDQCRRLLEDLRRLSSLMATAPLPAVPQAALNRMHGSWWAARRRQDRALRRLAGWMTFAAAAAAIALVFWPLGSGSGRPDVSEGEPVTVWEELTYIPPITTREDPASELVQVAQWMANDLSAEQMR